ncbi:uncharacterized protein B0P05DRAFT_559177 [Gilbertella persicaria]|uniref:uncharacterized protein n=1 Tax=Gilbertella persicaria TaxID=101096 RepID=UPI002220E1D3|nr:uncharacterized protein B0P05DRAFT_559177 [Gilbertella persicaria]KAI8058957.1 hypothetical protein B0P05DRAFT_559177 [Gilbertella persicaria]
MKILELPNEILQLISDYLPKNSMTRLCLTCIKGYQSFLPILYRHIELGHRTQIKQLEKGLLRNAYLKETVKTHTQILTLKCRQGGNSHWLVISLFEQLPNVKRLYFCDFLALSITKVRQVLCLLPRLSCLYFQYCDLTTTTTATTMIDSYRNLPNLKELTLLWTDFSTEAIEQLLSFTPHLNHIVLGANHNRRPSANNSALHMLAAKCPDIHSLSISLQQIKEDSLCRVIQLYGPQLEYLSIRCEGSNTLMSISQHTKRLKHLVIRCSNYTGYNSVMNVLQHCRSLTHLEMVSWPLHDVPSVVLEQIRVRDKGTATQASTISFLEGIKRTVALDRQDLQEIRRLCLY